MDIEEIRLEALKLAYAGREHWSNIDVILRDTDKVAKFIMFGLASEPVAETAAEEVKEAA